MIEAIDKMMLALAIRVIASWKTTLFGVLLGLGTDALTQLQLVPNQYVHALALLLGGVFVTFRDTQYAKGTAVRIVPPLVIAFVFFFPMRAAHAQTPEEVASENAIFEYHALASGTWFYIGEPSNTIDLPGTMVLANISAGFKAGTPGAATGAAAVETGTPPVVNEPPPAPTDITPTPIPVPGPAIGGCFTVNLCIGPAVAMSVTAINLSAKKVEAAFQAGAGLQLTYGQGWKQIGVGGYMNLDPGFNHAFAAGMLSFLGGYARVGLSKGFVGDDQSTRLLLSLGVL